MYERKGGRAASSTGGPTEWSPATSRCVRCRPEPNLQAAGRGVSETVPCVMMHVMTAAFADRDMFDSTAPLEAQ